MKWIGIAIVLAPVSFALTIALLPLWAWVERAFGIESIGHSGPAEWCYAAGYGVTLALAFLVIQSRRRRRSREAKRSQEAES